MVRPISSTRFRCSRSDPTASRRAIDLEWIQRCHLIFGWIFEQFQPSIGQGLRFVASWFFWAKLRFFSNLFCFVFSDSTILPSCPPEIVVSPPFVYLDLVSNTIQNKMAVAAQNCYLEEKGAFTGEIRFVTTYITAYSSSTISNFSPSFLPPFSPAMLKDCGINWVILGHSERRHILKETDDVRL
jgi:hypothetical protein